MRADNRGEGGILALTALVSRGLEQHDAAALVAGRLRHLRRGDVLRRRHDHAGDLGAGRGRGPRDHHAAAAPVHRAGHARDHRRAVRDPEARHGERRRAVRAGDVRCGSSCSRCWACCRSRSNPAVLAALNPALRGRASSSASPLLAFLALGAVVLAVTGHRGALRRHGPLRRARRSAARGSSSCAGAGAQLLRPGRAAARRPGGDQEPVLPARAAVGADPAGGPRDLRGGHRVAGGDLGRLLAHARRRSRWATARA